MHLRSKNENSLKDRNKKDIFKVFLSIVLCFIFLGLIIGFSNKSKYYLNKKYLSKNTEKNLIKEEIKEKKIKENTNYLNDKIKSIFQIKDNKIEKIEKENENKNKEIENENQNNILNIENKNNIKNYLNNNLENTKKEFVLRMDNKFLLANENIINLQIADNDIDRQKGLGGIKDLKIYEIKNNLSKNNLNNNLNKNTFETEGMLFVFPKLGVYTFWMKDTLFDLDILWLDENYKVVHIEKNVSRFSYNYNDSVLSKTFSNDKNSLAKYVLEIKAGFTDKLNIKLGDRLNLEK